MAKQKVDLRKKQIAAPALAYEPKDPKKYHPPIGLIACGGITWTHLTAYKKAGYNVVALCDLIKERAEKRREEFFPKADIYVDYHELLDRDDIEVVDIATHPQERLAIIKDALLARKNVLSQKPFVLDLDNGRKLVDLAKKQKVHFAVNQNGRWAPNFSYIRTAIDKGLVGDVIGAHLSVHWDHNWVTGTPFERLSHVILYDFAIHWFDILTCFMGGRMAKRVYASYETSPGQRSKRPMLGQVLIEYDGAQATLVFDADCKFGGQDRTYVGGTKGSITSYSTNGTPQEVTLYTPKGFGSPKLKGNWFPDGFHGTMGELLRSIEEKREPYNSAENNLKSLALCFAALESSETHKPQVPGKVKKARM